MALWNLRLELEAKIEDVKSETVTGPFHTFYDPMKAIYDELMAKHGGNLKKVRAYTPKVNYVIGNLPPHIKEVLRATTETLLFSADGFAKQLNHHPDLTTKEYADVFDKLKDCKEVYEGKDARIALIVKDDRYYAVLIKTTRSKTENYLVSLHRLDKDSLGVFRKLKRIY